MIPGLGRSAREGIDYPLQYSWASLVAQLVKNLPVMWETWVRPLGWEDSLEKGKATHSNIWPGGFHGLHSPWNSPGQNAGVGSLSLLQGIFPTQGLNPGIPHYRQILYQLSHKGSPRILEWIAVSSSGGSSSPRDQTCISCIGRQILY